MKFVTLSIKKKNTKLKKSENITKKKEKYNF